jgi:hypothetical protein
MRERRESGLTNRNSSARRSKKMHFVRFKEKQTSKGALLQNIVKFGGEV